MTRIKYCDHCHAITNEIYSLDCPACRSIKIGVVGSRVRIPRYIVEQILDTIRKNNTMIVSGKAKGVDTFAEEWADKNGVKKIIHEPTEQNKSEYFKRNGLIARDSDTLLAFIPLKKYRSGTWNTINQFVKLGKKDFKIYTERGEPWDKYNYPEWLIKNMERYI